MRAPTPYAYVPILALLATGCPGTLDSTDPDSALSDDARMALPDSSTPDEMGPTPDAGPDGPPRDSGADAEPVDVPDADSERDAALPPPPPPPPPSGPVLYPAGRRHSPITEDLAAGLRDVATRHPARMDDVFAKVGDSITVGTTFLHCFAGTRVDLGGRDVLQPTLDFFRAGDAAGTTPFDRTSLAATVGWSASAALAGTPSPLDRELAAIEPRFMVLMFGTNDVGFRNLESFTRDMLTIVDRALAVGTIPLTSSIPPRDDSSDADARVPLLNLAVRALAQGRGVPFVDYHRELLPLPAHGLAGDGVHPQSSGGGCLLTDEGLQAGVNVRNLLVLEQLDRVRRALEADPAPDADAPRLRGDGSAALPFEIEELPFATLHDTRGSSHRDLSGYSCSDADEAGPELRYRFSLDAPARVTAAIFSAAGADIDVHVLDSSGAAAGCLGRDNQRVTLDLGAGTHHVVADTFVSGGVEQSGEYVIVVARE